MSKYHYCHHHLFPLPAHTPTHTHTRLGCWPCQHSSFTALTVHWRAIRNILRSASYLKRPVICHFSSYGTLSESGGCCSSGTYLCLLSLWDRPILKTFNSHHCGCGELPCFQLFKPTQEQIVAHHITHRREITRLLFQCHFNNCHLSLHVPNRKETVFFSCYEKSMTAN